jgi:hypothetical protein
MLLAWRLNYSLGMEKYVSQAVLVVWSRVIATKTLGQVQGFSARKGLANMLPGLLAVAVSVLVLIVIAALLFAR